MTGQQQQPFGPAQANNPQQGQQPMPYGRQQQPGQPIATQQGAIPGSPIPGGTMPEVPPLPQKPKKPKSFWISIICVVLAIIIIVILLLMNNCTSFALRDPNASLGQLEGKTEEQIQEDLDRQVEEGMFHISIASAVEMESGSDPVNLQVENVPGNNYLMMVTLTNNDTSQVLYQSGIIDIGYSLKPVELDQDLEPGEYDCTATFTALDVATEEPVGQTSTEIRLIVNS